MVVPEQRVQDKRVIIVSNRLPVSVSRKSGNLSIAPSVGGLATGLSGFHQSSDGLWVGWPGTDPGSQKKKSELEEVLKAEYNCFPVYLSASDLKKYYYGFSNRTIWPLFHYFTTYCTYDASEWEIYKKVNQSFCRRLLEIIEPDDIVWIHDYHLLLLPGLLRSEIPNATIGFFLHIPFPSMEIFRYLPWREDVLQGMLGADLIGFHTYDYTRHFLSCALRILGKEQLYGKIVADTRMVKVDTFPMGIDAKRFIEAASSAPVIKRREALHKKIKAEKIILSVDRLDFTKGIPERLKAFERFLDKYPEWHGRITYILLCVPSRTKVKEYQQLKNEIDALVGQINGRYDTPDWQPILYMYRSLPFEELVALYSVADLALVTPLRDGMNLVAKEYLASQDETAKGALVLSETAGAAAELGEAIIVNPNDIRMMAEAIAEGLTISGQDKKVSTSFMIDRIKKYNIFYWAEDFVNQLVQTKGVQDQNRQRFFVDRHRDELKAEYRSAKNRLLLLDYDGTLVSLAKRPELASPDPEILSILSNLMDDPKNTVVVISGRDKDSLTRWLGGAGIDLVAEHGTWFHESSRRDWQLTDQNLTEDWKHNIYPILEMFSVRTPGSFIEEKTYALAWHYRKADPVLGTLRSNELNDALHDILSGTDLLVLQGNKVLEIKPVNINKGKAAMHWLNKAVSWDFILAIGDDWTDEDMFSILPDTAWSIKVGFVPFTRARFLMESPASARSLLKNLEGS